MEQLKTIGRELAIGSQTAFRQSREFLELVKSIGEARSKSEEDRIILHEIETLRRRIVEPDIPKRKMKEYIIRLVYVEMLGQDASFGHIHAVKMTHDDTLLFKRTGYLAVTLFLDEDHDLIILIVNTIQKDLKSDNYLVVCAALNAVCRLINEDTIPAVLPRVVELLGHHKEAVRKKAIMVLHRFHQKSPAMVSDLISNFRKSLCDSDPGVMAATLCPLFDLIKKGVNSYKDLVVSFVSILKQVTERRLPKSYDYHHMPAPFIQIKLLKILALLGSGDKLASAKMYTVVCDIIRKCDAATNIGNAVLYECICCISCLYPNTKSLEAAAEAISKFLKSDSHNLKYMGIDALGRLISVSPEVAEQHQLAVIDCLEDPDDTLKRKTFELLYKMTKSSNVEVIVDRMIDYMVNISDNHYKSEIASRCVQLAEQFAPTSHWFIQTMNRVFRHAGNLVNSKVAHNFLRLIAEGFSEDDDTVDSQLRSSAVDSYLSIIGKPKLPSLFLQVICWVLGEYGTADGKYSAAHISGKLCDISDAYSSDGTIKAYAISALMKLFAFEIVAGRKLDMLPECQSLVEELSASNSTDLQQRAYELLALIRLDAQTVEAVIPLDASCEDIEVDKSLSFLNNYVQQSLERGAQAYIPESKRSRSTNFENFRSRDQNEAPTTHGLRFEAYEFPKPSFPYKVPSDSHLSSTELSSSVPELSSSIGTTMNRSASVSSIPSSGATELKLRLDGVQRKWGRPTHTDPSSAHKTKDGFHQADITGTTTSKAAPDFRKPRIEVSPEKQKLAASLFGNSSKPEKKPPLAVHKVPKKDSSVSSLNVATEKTACLLDLGEPTDTGISTSDTQAIDPFKQLEGLLNYPESTSGEKHEAANPLSGGTPLTRICTSTAPSQVPYGSGLAQFAKGPNLNDSLEKDARVRQMGVTPASQNPNLFKDLLR